VFLGRWVVPAFTFLWLIDSTEPGHALVFVGALVALAAGLLAHLGPRRGWLLAAGVAAVQAGVFLFAGPISDRPLAWTIDSMLLNVTAPGLRAQQASLDDALLRIRTASRPESTAVVTVVGQDAYRFMMYYLPEYTVVRLDPSTHAVLTAHNRSQDSWTKRDCVQAANPLWVLWAPTATGTIPSEGERISSTEGPFQVWQVPARDTDVDYLGFRIASSCA
jgi:hypothetical protein